MFYYLFYFVDCVDIVVFVDFFGFFCFYEEIFIVIGYFDYFMWDYLFYGNN